MTDQKKPDATKADEPKKGKSVKVRFDTDSWKRNRGDVKEVPAEVAERLIRDGHATPAK